MNLREAARVYRAPAANMDLGAMPGVGALAEHSLSPSEGAC